MQAAQLENVQVSLSIPRNQLTIGARIGEGGFGIVHSGLYNQFKVAIKLLRESNLGAEEFESFKLEIHTMVKLKSPHIIQFYGISVY